MNSTGVTCRLEFLRNVYYRHWVFPETDEIVHLYGFLRRHLVHFACHVVVKTRRLFRQAVISIINSAERWSLTGLITLRLGTYNSCTVLGMFRLDFEPTRTLIHGGSSRIGSSEFFEYDFLFVHLSEMSVRSRPFENADCAPVM